MLTAVNSYHWAECGYVEKLLEDKELNAMGILSLRIVTSAGKYEILNPQDEILNSDLVYTHNNYPSVFSQQTHDNERQPGEMFRRILSSIYLANILRLSYFLETTYSIGEFYDDGLPGFQIIQLSINDMALKT